MELSGGVVIDHGKEGLLVQVERDNFLLRASVKNGENKFFKVRIVGMDVYTYITDSVEQPWEKEDHLFFNKEIGRVQVEMPEPMRIEIVTALWPIIQKHYFD